jgi:hypothetical protein
MSIPYGDAVLAGWALSGDPSEGAPRWGWYAMSDYVVGDFVLPIPDVGSSLTNPTGTWELIVNGNWNLLVVDPPDEAGNGTGRIGTTPMTFTWDDVAQGISFRAVPDPQDREDVRTPVQSRRRRSPLADGRMSRPALSAHDPPLLSRPTDQRHREAAAQLVVRESSQRAGVTATGVKQQHAPLGAALHPLPRRHLVPTAASLALRGGCRTKPWGLARGDGLAGGVRPGRGRVGRCDRAGAFSGPHGGYLVSVELGEVVSHHD